MVFTYLFIFALMSDKCTQVLGEKAVGSLSPSFNVYFTMGGCVCRTWPLMSVDSGKSSTGSSLQLEACTLSGRRIVSPV